MAHVSSRIRKKVESLFRRASGALLADATLADEAAHLDPAGALAEMKRELDGEVGAAVEPQFGQLSRALAGGEPERRVYIERYGVAGVRRFHSCGGARIYAMSVETFPGHVNNVYLLLHDGSAVLFDCGSGLDSSRRDLAMGFAVVRAAYDEAFRGDEIDWCVVSHAHYDHFGGANAVRRLTRGRVAVHELDARVLSCFDERLVMAAKDRDVYWRRAGLPDAERAALLEMYTSAKTAFEAQEVDRILLDGDTIGPGYRVHHVPGHCPGLVCLQVHDVLLTSDHVLSRITPHQFPQAITAFAGLEHYFHSLAKVRRLEGIHFALGGHEEPIWDLPARVDEIALFHRNRLARVLELCAQPQTVAQVSHELFGPQEGYSRILAYDEAGAHVEYLHQHGRLRIANLEDVARAPDPVFQYVVRS